MVHSGRSLLNENKEKLSEETVDKLAAALDQATPLDDDSLDMLKEKSANLQEVMSDVAKEMYASADPPPEDSGPEPNVEDDVIDADFVEDQE